MKVTRYFEAIRQREDRAAIQNEWIERAMKSPIRQFIQEDGRIRRWCHVPEMNNRYLRVILLPGLARGKQDENSATFRMRRIPVPGVGGA